MFSPPKTPRKLSSLMNFFGSDSLDEKKEDIIKEKTKEETPKTILFLGSNKKIAPTLFDIAHGDNNLYKKDATSYCISALENISDSRHLANLAVQGATIIGLCPEDDNEREELKKFLIPIDNEIAPKPYFDLTEKVFNEITKESLPLLITANSSAKIFLLEKKPSKDLLGYYENSFIILQPYKDDHKTTSTYYVSSDRNFQFLDCNETEHPAFSSLYFGIKKAVQELCKDKKINIDAHSLQSMGLNNWQKGIHDDELDLLNTFLKEIDKIIKKTNIDSILTHCEKSLPKKLCSTEVKGSNTPRFNKEQK